MTFKSERQSGDGEKMNEATLSAINGVCSCLGISPPPSEILIYDGKVRRYHDSLNDKSTDKNGWFKGCDNADGTFGGTVGHWRLGIKANWSSIIKRQFSAAERAEYARKMQEMRQQEAEAREAQYKSVAQKADAIWRSAKPASHKHPYLVRKGINPHGLKHSAMRLVVPLRDSCGFLWSLQFIDLEGGKMFLSGGRTAACYWSIGRRPETHILLAEGAATAATLYEASGLPVASAMNAGNLPAVALALHEKYPVAKILICADADPVGMAKAEQAADLVDGMVITPDFSAGTL